MMPLLGRDWSFYNVSPSWSCSDIYSMKLLSVMHSFTDVGISIGLHPMLMSVVISSSVSRARIYLH